MYIYIYRYTRLHRAMVLKDETRDYVGAYKEIMQDSSSETFS